MASLDTGGDGGGHKKKGPGVKKAKKQSTRVDMTPMVDLGFLLITFFIYTTTLSTPSTLGLNMPKDDKDPENQTEVKQSGALTIMLGKENHVFYYEGELDPVAGKNFTPSTFMEIRKVINDKRKEVISIHRHDAGCEKIQQRAKDKDPNDPNWQKACEDKDFMVIIKPNAEANYKNTVDILDEMTINAVKRYAIVDIADVENQLIAATEGAAPQKK